MSPFILCFLWFFHLTILLVSALPSSNGLPPLTNLRKILAIKRQASFVGNEFKPHQQTKLTEWLIHRKWSSAPPSFYKSRIYYLVLLQACDNKTNGEKREETNIGSQMAFSAATEEESMLPARDGRAGETLNRKSDGFPFRKLNDFESRNGGREG